MSSNLIPELLAQMQAGTLGVDPNQLQGIVSALQGGVPISDPGQQAVGALPPGNSGSPAGYGNNPYIGLPPALPTTQGFPAYGGSAPLAGGNVVDSGLTGIVRPGQVGTAVAPEDMADVLGRYGPTDPNAGAGPASFRGSLEGIAEKGLVPAYEEALSRHTGGQRSMGDVLSRILYGPQAAAAEGPQVGSPEALAEGGGFPSAGAPPGEVAGPPAQGAGGVYNFSRDLPLYVPPTAPTELKAPDFGPVMDQLGPGPERPKPYGPKDKMGDFLGALAGGAARGLRGERGGNVASVLSSAGHQGSVALTELRNREEARNDQWRRENERYRSAKAEVESRSLKAKTDAEWQNAKAQDAFIDQKRKESYEQSQLRAGVVDSPRAGIIRASSFNEATGQMDEIIYNIEHEWKNMMANSRYLAALKSNQKDTEMMHPILGEMVPVQDVVQSFGPQGPELLAQAQQAMLTMFDANFNPDLRMAIDDSIQARFNVADSEDYIHGVLMGRHGEDGEKRLLGTIFGAIAGFQNSMEGMDPNGQPAN